MNKAKNILDFIVYLLFITTIIATLSLIAAGTYYMVTNPGPQVFYIFGASIITLLMHIGIRIAPTK